MRLCEASRLPEQKFQHETLIRVVRDVILDTSGSLDPYCYARVKFWARRTAESCPVRSIISALSKLSAGMALQSREGAMPRLLEALPPKKKLGVLMAGLWVADTEDVVRVAMELSGYKCARAARDAVAWFKTTVPFEHIGAL